jgi:hypothetical protein
LNVVFFPGVPRCETCDCGLARIVIDDVSLCEACAQVLAVPARIPDDEQSQMPEHRPAPPLHDVIDTILRGQK